MKKADEMDEVRRMLEMWGADLRRRIEPAFSADTTAPGFPLTTASSGQCAAVSAIVATLTGALMVSASIGGLSHWFNRVNVNDLEADIDLTGDQFGRPMVQVGEPGTLYEDTRLRSDSELNAETRLRAAVLAERSGLIGDRAV